MNCSMNCSVNEDVLNDMTTISTNVILILDAWQSFVNGDGTVTINEVLSNNLAYDHPTAYALTIYIQIHLIQLQLLNFLFQIK